MGGRREKAAWFVHSSPRGCIGVVKGYIALYGDIICVIKGYLQYIRDIDGGVYRGMPQT